MNEPTEQDKAQARDDVSHMLFREGSRDKFDMLVTYRAEILALQRELRALHTHIAVLEKR